MEEIKKEESTKEVKTFPIILERVVAGEVDETGRVVKLSDQVAPLLTIQALMTTINQLTKKQEEKTQTTEGDI